MLLENTYHLHLLPLLQALSMSSAFLGLNTPKFVMLNEVEVCWKDFTEREMSLSSNYLHSIATSTSLHSICNQFFLSLSPVFYPTRMYSRGKAMPSCLCVCRQKYPLSRVAIRRLQMSYSMNNNQHNQIGTLHNYVQVVFTLLELGAPFCYSL